MINFIIILAVLIVAPSVAAAGPVGVAIAAINAFAASSLVAGLVVRVAIYAGLSALGAALRGKPEAQRQAGIKTEVTTTGGANPQTFILGRYATAGNRVAPPYSGPNRGDVPNEYLTYAVDISDLPITSLARIAINGDWVTDLRASGGLHQKEGMIINGDGVFDLNAQYPLFSYSFYDGNQTAADAYMMANHASDVDRPWQTDMIGAGVAYAVLTFKYNRAAFNGLPAFLFEVEGIKLYDPRRDTSVGGSGAQRWGNRDTWAFTENPAVMIYNILRGVTLPDGNIWGGRVAAADLPLANWFAAMNECDVVKVRKDGTSVAQYIAGFEVSVDQEPATVIDALKNACAGEVVEAGGVYTMRVGPVAMPVFFFTDDDLSVDDPRSLSPHSGLDAGHNALHVTHPAPEAMWTAHDAPPRYDLEAELEDGRRLQATLDLPAVARDEQVQRLMSLWLKDERRMRRHDLTLPPEAAVLDPLDAVAWTSARNGYTSKVFEVGDIADDFTTLNQTVSLRERDANDVNWVPATDETAVTYPALTVKVMPARILQNWRLEPAVMLDETGDARRVGLRMLWDGDNLGDATGIRVQIRIVGASDLSLALVIGGIDRGDAAVFEGILPGLRYEARARLISDRVTSWTLWDEASTDGVYIGAKDIAYQILADIAAAGAAADAAQADLNALVVITEGEFEAARNEIAVVRGDLVGAQEELGLSIDGLSDRVAATEVGISSEATARTSADTSLTNSITAAVSRIASSEAAIASEATTRASVDSAAAGTVSALTARVGSAEGAITAEQTARANADSAIVGTANALAARVGSAEGAITAEQTARANADSAIVGTANALAVRVGSAEGAITSEATTRANADGALSGRIDTINADLTGKYLSKAQIQSTYLTSAQTNSAIASSQTTLQASIDTLDAEVSDVAGVTVTLDGKVRAFRGMRAYTQNGGTEIASIRLTSYSDPDGTGGSAIQMDADNVLVNGTLSASKMAAKTITAVSGVIGDAAVDTLQIKGEAVTVANFGVRNSPIVVGESGWTDIVSVNLDCESAFSVFAIASMSTQAASYVGLDDVGSLEYRFTHQGNTFGQFWERAEVESIPGDNASEELTRISASNDCMAYMKSLPGTGVKTFKLQAKSASRDRVVTEALLRVQMVKR
jgi:hypothetical protein